MFVTQECDLDQSSWFAGPYQTADRCISIKNTLD